MNQPASKTQVATKKKLAVSLLDKFAVRYAIDPTTVLPVLRATAFNTGKGNPPATNEEVQALMIVADQYNLNPFTKEIYAFRNKGGGITPIVGFDGWIRLVEAQPAYNGCTFTEGFDTTSIANKEDSPQRGFYYECTMHRKDRAHPTTIREYLGENYRNTDPWNDMPSRMTRMRSYIQCARLTFGFGGIYEQSEGEAIAMGSGVDYISAGGQPGHSKAPAMAASAEEPPINDDQLEQLKEKLAKTGVPDNVVLARFEVGELSELKFHQFPEAMKFVQDNAP
jgi:phage recombination protein Bet